MAVKASHPVPILDRHPLQRIHSPSRTVSAFLHVVGLASLLSSFKFLIDNPNQINESYGWHFQYLTIIGLTFATVTFVVGLLADVTLSKRLFALKNAASVASAPLEVLISLLYWGLGFIDPGFVVSDWLPPLPLYADIGFHAMPAIFIVIDALFLSPPWTVSVIVSATLSSTIAILYWIWVETCYFYNGFYPYPIFELGLATRVFLFTMSAVLMVLGTSGLKLLYRLVNGTVIRKE